QNCGSNEEPRVWHLAGDWFARNSWSHAHQWFDFAVEGWDQPDCRQDAENDAGDDEVYAESNAFEQQHGFRKAFYVFGFFDADPDFPQIDCRRKELVDDDNQESAYSNLHTIARVPYR